MAYLQITLDISEKNRAAAAAVYQKYKAPFLSTIDGAVSKNCWYVPKMCRFCIVSTRLNRLRRISDLSYLPQMWLRRSNPI